MKRKVSKIAGLIMLMLAVMLVVSDVGTMNVSAAENGTGLYSESYDDVNTLNATITVKSNILKVKKNNAAQAPKPTKVVVNGVTLKLNKNYTVSYQKYDDGWEDVKNLTGVGTYRICVTGKGDYTGVSTKRIYVYDPIQRIPMSAVKITVNKVSYTGSAITDGVIKSVKYKNSELVEGKDYTVTYLSNVNSGTGIVRISGVESVGYVGERDVKFTITGGKSIAKAKVTGITAKTYIGIPVRQDLSEVSMTLGGKTIEYGKDYELAYYANNLKAGTAKVVFTGKGAYYGNLTKTFKINKVKLTKNMLEESSRNIVMQYTGKALKPDVELCYDDNIMTKGVDYTLTYKNNVKVSEKAMITVKGKGNYTGTLNVSFTITDEKPEAEEPFKTKEPDTEEPETKEPETEVPGTEVPDTEVPETNNPETEVPETKETDTEVPDTEVPDTEVPETKEPETEASSETGKPDDTAEGEDKSEASKPDNPTEGTTDGRDDNTSGDGESTEYGTDGDDIIGDENTQDLKCYHHKPISFRICSCGAICPFYVYGTDRTPQGLYEGTVWNNHHDENHIEENSYTAISYEKALKYKAIKEDENGNWTWIKEDDIDRGYGHVMHYHVLDSWLGE